jgi:hypothetical protein
MYVLTVVKILLIRQVARASNFPEYSGFRAYFACRAVNRVTAGWVTDIE